MLKQVEQIAREAAVLMGTRDFSIENKGSVGNDVTTVDKQVQEYIRTKLHDLDETIGFIGEESGEQDYRARRAWVVDPIDGTANFIRDLHASVISIGLVEYGEAVLGVVYNPYQDEMFSAEKGKGASCGGVPVTVSERPFEKSIFCTAFCLYERKWAEVCQSILTDVYAHCEDFRRFGTAALEMTALAAGKVDLYYEMRLYPWDYAASAIIIREAGGFVGTVSVPGIHESEDSRLIYDRPIPIIAANTRENYELLREIVERHIRSLSNENQEFSQ